jgi:hypothetical protein
MWDVSCPKAPLSRVLLHAFAASDFFFHPLPHVVHEKASAAMAKMSILVWESRALEDFGSFAAAASSRVFPLFVWHGGVSLPLVLGSGTCCAASFMRSTGRIRG